MDISMMTYEETEKRLSEIKTEMDAPEADLATLKTEVDAIEARRADIMKAEEERKALADRIATGEEPAVVVKTFEEERNTMNTIETRNTKEYIDAFADYIKSGDATECRSLLTENVSGTVAVPDLVDNIVRTAWDKEGIMSLVKKSYLAGNLKVGFEISATGAVVHTEGSAAPAEETLTLGIVTLVPASIKKWITLSDEVMDMRGSAFLEYVYSEVAYQIAKKAADEIIADIEASTSTGSATAPAVPEVTESTIALGTVANAVAQLSDEASNPVIVMNKATWSAFKAVQYAGNYAVDPFEGMQVLFNNTIKSYAAASSGETYAIVGDFGYGAQANFPNGAEIKFTLDDKSLAEKDLIKIVGREYVGHGVVAPNAFVKIKK